MKYNLLLPLVFLFIISNIVIYIRTEFNKNEKIQLDLDQRLYTLETYYKIAQKQNKVLADISYKFTINTPEVIDILKKAQNADTKERLLLRDQLIKVLTPQYERMKIKGMEIFQFVLPNNHSFLRMHKQERFDDDLSSVRYSYVYVNKTHHPIQGFERGKATDAFRYVYPIFDQLTNQYLGAVELSFNSNYIQNIIYDINHIHTHFIVHKDILKANIWETKKKEDNFVQSNEHKNYMLTIYNHEQFHYCSMNNHKIIKGLEDTIQTNIDQGEKFVLFNYHDEHAHTLAFYPVKNIQENKTVAWLISYERSELITTTLQSAKFVRVLSFFLFLILYYFIYKVLLQNQYLKKQQEELRAKDLQIKGQIDIANTQRDRAEKLAKSKAEFLANMSHEIRTPLNAITGFVELLKEESKGRKALEYVNIIDKSSHSLLKIIEDILDFSKIESGKLNIEKIYFNPINEFTIITDLFKSKCLEKNITLHVNIDTQIPYLIKTDPLRIKQIISNLLSNAIKFTSDGKNIYVDILYDNRLLKISVKDEGKGIAHNKLDHIFEAFSQEDSSTTRNYGGTGLGLSISAQLVKILGGSLNVKSELGKGSDFYFSIPIEVEANKKSLYETFDTTTTQHSFNHQKILLVEDNPANQMLMEILLKKLNLSFECASNGSEAVKMYIDSIDTDTNRSFYHIILMDENMPKMNGIEATKQILSYEQKNQLYHIPIIALTANALKGDRERFLSAGMDEYLTKPINKNKLEEILHKFI